MGLLIECFCLTRADTQFTNVLSHTEWCKNVHATCAYTNASGTVRQLCLVQVFQKSAPSGDCIYNLLMSSCRFSQSQEQTTNLVSNNLWTCSSFHSCSKESQVLSHTWLICRSNWSISDQIHTCNTTNVMRLWIFLSSHALYLNILKINLHTCKSHITCRSQKNIYIMRPGEFQMLETVGITAC